MNRPTPIVSSLLAVVAGAVLGWAVAAWVTRPLIRDAVIHSSGPRKPASLNLAAASRLEHQMDAVRAAGPPSAQIAAAVALAARVDPADFARFLENLDRLPPPSARRLASHALMRRWVSHDPEAALRWCRDDPANADWVKHVAAEWAKRDPAQAEATITSLRVHERASTLSAIASAFALQGNLKGALDLLLNPELNNDRFSLDDPRRETFAVLADRDPNWLASQIDSLPTLMQDAARDDVIHALAKGDVRTAFEWAAAQPDREAYLSEVVEGASNPADWLAALVSLPAELLRDVKVTSWFDHFAPDEAVDALTSHASQLPDPLRSSLMEYLDSELASSSDPGALANRVLAVDDLRPYFSVATFMIYWHLEEAPAAAKAWCESLQDESLRTEAQVLISHSNRVEAARAYARLPLAEQLVMDAGKNGLNSTHRLLALDPSARRAVLEAGFARTPMQEPEDPFASGINVVEAMAERYPSETAEWLSEKIAAGATPQLAATTCTAASWWAGESPREAATWVASLPPGDARAWAAANVAFQWRLVDPAAARAWLDSLPPADRAVAARALESAPGPPP